MAEETLNISVRLQDDAASGDQVARALEEALSKAIDKVGDKLTASLNAALEGISSKAADNITQAFAGAGDAILQVAARTQRLEQSLTQIAGLGEQFGQFTQAFTDAAPAFEALAESVGRIGENTEVLSELSTTFDSINQNITGLVTSFQEVTVQLNDIAQSVGDINGVAQAFNKVGQAASSASNNAAGIGNQFEELDDLLNNISESQQAFAESTEEFTNPQAYNVLATVLGRLGVIFDQINNNIDNLDPKTVRALTQAFESLKQIAIATRQEIARDERVFRESQQAIQRELTLSSRERLQISKQESAQKIVDLQTTAAREVAEIRASSAQQVALTNAANRSRVASFEFAARAIRSIERSLRTVFEQTTRVLSTVFRGFVSLAETAANGVTRAFSRSNTEIVNNYNQVLQQNSQATDEALQQQERRFETFSQRVNESIGNIGLGQAVGLGAVGAFFGDSLRRGFARFATLEESARGLNILLQDATKSARLLDGVLDVVIGTPFGLELFADAAAQLVTFNVEASRVPRLLEAISDAAALKGSRAPEFIGRLVTIFGQISAQGRLTGRSILQLSQAGVPALQILGNQLGKTVLEVRELAAAGQLGADSLDLLATGIIEGTDGVNDATVAFGGLAKSLGDTLRGAIANLGAARARLGAAIIAPFSDAALKILSLLKSLTDELTRFVSTALTTFTSTFIFRGFERGITEFADNFSRIFDRLRPAITALAQSITVLGVAFVSLGAARFATPAVAGLAIALRRLITPVRVAFVAFTTLIGAFRRVTSESLAFSTGFGFLAESIRRAFAPLGDAIRSILGPTSQLRIAIRELFEGAFRVFAVFINNVVAPALFRLGQIIRVTVVPAVEAFSENLSRIIREDAIGRLSQGFTRAFEAVGQFAAFVVGRVLPVLGRIAAVIAGVVIVAVERLVTLFRTTLIPAFQRVIEQVRQFVTGLSSIPDALRAFGASIARVFTERDFAGIPAAFGDLLLGLGPIAAVAGAIVAAKFVNPFFGIGVLIAAALAGAFGPQLIQRIQPRLNDLRNRLENAFSFDNILGVSLNILNLVNRLGRVLGRVVSDPRLLSAVAGIAAVGVAVAGSFIVGVIQGISDNIPKLIRGIQNLLGKALLEGFKAALTSPAIAAALLAGFSVLLFGPSLFGALRARAAFQGQTIGQNFTNGVRNTITKVQPLPGSAATFFQGLFGGPQALQAAAQAQARQVAQTISRETQRQFRTAQAFGIERSSVTGQQLSARDIGFALSRLQQQIGAVGIASGLARSSFQRLGASFVQVATAARTSSVAIANSLRSLNFQQAIAGARNFGLTFQVALGRARLALTDLATSFRTIAPQLFRQAGAIAGAAFATSFAAQALFTEGATGGERAGSILGIAATFGATAAIAGPKAAALATGVGLLAGAFQASAARAREATERIREFAEIVEGFDDPRGLDAQRAQIDAFVNSLSDLERQAFLAAGFSTGAILNLSNEDIARFKELADIALPSLFQQLTDFGGFGGLRAQDALQEIADAFGITTKQAEDFARALQRLPEIELGTQRAEERRQALAVDDTQAFLDTLTGSVQEFARALLDQGFSLDQVNTKIDQVTRRVPAATRAFAQFLETQIGIGASANDAIKALRELGRERVEELRKGLTSVRESIDSISQSVTRAEENLRRFVTGISFSEFFDQPGEVIAFARAAEELESLFGRTGIAAEAEILQVLQRLRDGAFAFLEPGLREAIRNGTDFTRADAEQALSPLFRLAEEAGGALGFELVDLLEDVLSNLDDPEFAARLDTSQIAVEAEQFAKDEEGRFQVLLSAEIAFDETLIKEGSLEAARIAAQEVIDEGSAVFLPVGEALAEGIAAGIIQGSDAIQTSLEEIFGGAFDFAKQNIEARSPSARSAREIGFPISQGIAVGVAEGGPLVANAVNSVLNAAIPALGFVPLAEQLASRVGTPFLTAADAARRLAAATSEVSREVERANETVRIGRLNSYGNAARGAARNVEELALAITDLQRALLQEFQIFEFLPTDAFREVLFDEPRKALNDLLTGIGGVVDSFTKGLRDGTIAGVAQAANSFGEAQQRIIEGLREGIREGSIVGVSDVNRTLDLVGQAIADQLGPKNQQAIDEFNKLIDGLRKRSDIEALLRVTIEERSLQETQRRLNDFNRRLNTNIDLTSRVFRNLTTVIDSRLAALNSGLDDLFARLFGFDQLPGGPLGLPDIGVIEDYVKKATDALSSIFDRLLDRNQLATQAITGDLDDLIAQRAEALARISSAEGISESLRAESAGIARDLENVASGLGRAFSVFFERGAAGEGAFRAQARAAGLSAAAVEELIAKQRQLRLAQRDISEAQLLEAELLEKITEEREQLRTANIELLESSIALLDQGADGISIFQQIADAAGLNADEVAELTAAYRALTGAQAQAEAEELADQQRRLLEANQDLLESSLALIDAGPEGQRVFREIAAAAGVNSVEVEQLIRKYQELSAVEQEKIALDLALQQLELEAAVRDAATALQELIDLGPEGSDFFNRLAELSGLNVDTAKDLIVEYGRIVSENTKEPPETLFAELRAFTRSTIGVTEDLLDEYGNIRGAVSQPAPTGLFSSLVSQANGAANAARDARSALQALYDLQNNPPPPPPNLSQLPAGAPVPINYLQPGGFVGPGVTIQGGVTINDRTDVNALLAQINAASSLR